MFVPPVIEGLWRAAPLLLTVGHFLRLAAREDAANAKWLRAMLAI
jgi:hypothetical protein